MSHILSYDLVQAFAERSLDHERDTRPDVERIVLLTDEQLAALRGAVCKDCGSRDCQDPGCDRGCNRHANNMVEVRPLVVRFVCDRCVEEVECACGCGAVLPRWQMTYTDNAEGGGEWFGPECCGVEPGESW
jgi:hypothetical protein